MQYQTFLTRILELFTRNWKEKLVSLLLAGFFYINLQNSKILIKTINIPIDYPKLEGNLFYSKNPDKTFPVRVEGLREVVNYYSQFMKAVIDPADLVIGDQEVPIKRISGIPNGIKVTKLKKSVEVTIESLVTKQVPLDVVFEGELPSNFEKVSYSVKPNRITLSGKQSELDRIAKITLPPITLQDVNESFVRKIRLPELPRGLNVLGGTREVTVSVSITSQVSKSGEQIIAGIPVHCVGENAYLEPELSEDQVSVRIFTKSSLRSSAIISGIQATVPCNYTYDPVKKRIVPNDQPVVTKVRVSRSRELKNIDIVQVIPEKVTITYKLKEKAIQGLEDDNELEPSGDGLPPPPSETRLEGRDP